MDYSDEIRKQINEEFNRFQNEKLRIALVGQPGAGKSSLINKILGEKVFEVSPRTDTTKGAEEHEYKGMIITDLPGYGTDMFPVDDWAEQFNVGEYDIYLFVFSGKLHDSDSKLFNYLEKWQQEREHPYFIIRNKMDTLWDDEMSTEELKQIVEKDVWEKLGNDSAKVYFTSCRDGGGVEELKHAIENANISETKKQKFIFGMRARCLQDLEIKKEKAAEAVKMYALAGAANGINPVPGADVLLDMGILMKMAGEIREIFGVNSENDLDKAMKIAGPLAKEVMQYLSRETIVTFLKDAAKRYAVGKAVKYIPFLGQAIAAGISYFVMESFGTYYVGRCYELAKAILDNEVQQKMA